MKECENLPAVIYEVRPIRITDTPKPPTYKTKITQQTKPKLQEKRLGTYVDIYV